MIINPTKNKQNAALCQYFQASTADSKCMYNTANFYIRNTMTGLKKSPEERMHSEIEVLHYVFTGIQRYNDIKIKEIETLKLRSVGGLNCERIIRDILFKKLIQYPTREKWFLPYETLDAIFKLTGNPVYKRMNSQVNQNAIRKVIAAWNGYFKSLKQYYKTPSAFTGLLENHTSLDIKKMLNIRHGSQTRWRSSKKKMEKITSPLSIRRKNSVSAIRQYIRA